ncbi:S-adenosyl-L-methionine-dependent methyltransferase [Cryphonectria parasitica EP155]|uniref:S-adenosyl-L-methionine-dependent methyltransferase n=1 Tax=Cryphonectria parasitica (strain ATCC 38755 / EP155) TaxID=660469 RepID=A0A9P5CPY1_CRYP1|nr:S-adenosyl-L-methionine-dependent methyltransferase [Cryphonectria parasitica EP155]KAF3765666.1 S-adenosyl-L-methionine-dependent methyltransferase [Cryphonectria parasitica EP155]
MTAPKTAEKYNSQASAYEAYIFHTPVGRLETELYLTALGDATGLTVLDLGGGTGLRARQAVERGAARVDVVDISSGMMRIGKDHAERSGLGDRIRWFEADVSQPLGASQEDLKQWEGRYDIVLANWVFDHASSREMLEGMWQNVAAFLRPGGRFLTVYLYNARIGNEATGDQYGILLKNFEQIPGGLKYWCVLGGNDPPMEFEATSMEVMYSGSTELFDKFELEGVRALKLEDTKTVQSDPQFWEPVVQRPFLKYVTAQKKAAPGGSGH